jgi:hypothetical protein
MVSTRSKAAQTDLEDNAPKDSLPKGKGRGATTQRSPPKANTSRKRKSTNADEAPAPTAKRTKSSESVSKSTKTEEADAEQLRIIINRAPVLQLWSACVAHITYPNLSWETCLSAGSAISTICAVAKGRSIGTVPEKDESNEKAAKRAKAKKQQKELDSIQVMQFKLKLKDGLAVVGSEGKGKPGGEEALRKKFGEEQYVSAKEAFEEVLKSWKGEEDELNRKAFGFYEQFRPEVKSGQKGWGRKGELDLDKVGSVVSR